jgi:hypothetical protein
VTATAATARDLRAGLRDGSGAGFSILAVA